MECETQPQLTHSLKLNPTKVLTQILYIQVKSYLSISSNTNFGVSLNSEIAFDTFREYQPWRSISQ